MAPRASRSSGCGACTPEISRQADREAPGTVSAVGHQGLQRVRERIVPAGRQLAGCEMVSRIQNRDAKRASIATDHRAPEPNHDGRRLRFAPGAAVVGTAIIGMGRSPAVAQ